MKQIFSFLAIILLVFSLPTDLSAQKKGKKSKTETKSTADTLGLSYNYGILLGMSLQMQGVSPDSINSYDLLTGLEAALKNKIPDATIDKAQQIFTQKMEGIKKAAEAQSLIKEKEWFDDNAKKNSKIQTLPSGIQYEVMKTGNGPKPTPTSKVTTHYHGTLIDGKVFDSSVQRNTPASFPVNGVIKGWQEILVLMPVGSKWKVYIPSALAYGSRGTQGIAPNSILIFEIELLSID
jgi:FKBP-type peptidyl-prolyl cis-trans isomerase FklB